MGLSQNATRQLLFRARNAFKKALVGEAEIQGRSVSQVLSIAAKKAASEAKENALRIGAFIVLFAIGVGVVPSLAPSDEDVVAESFSIGITPDQSQLAGEPQAAESPSVNDLPDVATVAPEPTEALGNEFIQEAATSESAEELDNAEGNYDSTNADPAATSVVEPRLTNQSLGSIFATNVANASFYTDSYAVQFGELFRGVSVEVFGGTGVSAFLDLDIESKSVDQIIFQMRIDGERYYGAAKSFVSGTFAEGN